MENREIGRNPKVEEIVEGYMGLKQNAFRKGEGSSELTNFLGITRDFDWYVEARKSHKIDPDMHSLFDTMNERYREFTDEEITYIADRLRAD
jgi:hypothetical protein